MEFIQINEVVMLVVNKISIRTFLIVIITITIIIIIIIIMIIIIIQIYIAQISYV